MVKSLLNMNKGKLRLYMEVCEKEMTKCRKEKMLKKRGLDELSWQLAENLKQLMAEKNLIAEDEEQREDLLDEVLLEQEVLTEKIELLDREMAELGDRIRGGAKVGRTEKRRIKKELKTKTHWRGKLVVAARDRKISVRTGLRDENFKERLERVEELEKWQMVLLMDRKSLLVEVEKLNLRMRALERLMNKFRAEELKR